MIRFPRGTARFDLSDVPARERTVREVEARAIANELWLQRQLRAALAQKQRAWVLGYQSALEQVGGDITITDGIPIEVAS